MYSSPRSYTVRRAVRGVSRPLLRQALRRVRVRRLRGLLQAVRATRPTVRVQGAPARRLPRRQGAPEPVPLLPARKMFSSRHE